MTFLKSLVLLTGLIISNLHATVTLTWVAGDGDDANPGSRIAPGKTFAGMISKTTAGGQVSALNAGAFGSVTVNKAITLDGTSIPSNINIPSPAGIGVNVSAGASDVVILRNLTFNGLGTGGIGVQFNSGKQLIIEDCHFTGFVTRAIDINPSSGGNVVIRNTSISHVPVGINVNGTGAVNVFMSNVSVQDATTAGVDALVGTVQMVNSFLAQNAVGLKGEGSSTVSCVNTLFASNATGVQANGGSTVRISNNDFYNNTTAIDNSGGGTVATANNNKNADFTGTTSPTASIVLQ